MSALCGEECGCLLPETGVQCTSSADAHFSPWGWGWEAVGLWVTWGHLWPPPTRAWAPGVLVSSQHLQGPSSLPSFTRSALNPRRAHHSHVATGLKWGTESRCSSGRARSAVLGTATGCTAFSWRAAAALGASSSLKSLELEGVGVLCWPPGQMGPVAA